MKYLALVYLFNLACPEFTPIAVKIAWHESRFNHKIVNSTGDVGLGQINSKVWNKSTNWLLNIDNNISMMCSILRMHSKHSSSDKNWWTRYHSTTPRLRRRYLERVNRDWDFHENHYKTMKFSFLR